MNCEDCKHRIGDGHPYGDITCGINGKYRYMRRECDTGEYAPICSFQDVIKLCWDAIRRHTTRDTECLELHQVLEILSKEMEQLQAEVEGLKNRCPVCNGLGVVPLMAFGGQKPCPRCGCSNWQKAGE